MLWCKRTWVVVHQGVLSVRSGKCCDACTRLILDGVHASVVQRLGKLSRLWRQRADLERKALEDLEER